MVVLVVQLTVGMVKDWTTQVRVTVEFTGASIDLRVIFTLGGGTMEGK